MFKIFNKLNFEYKRGGFRHVLLGSVEKTLITILELFPNMYWLIAPRYYYWRSSNDIYQYQCPPDPFKIEYVSPSKIHNKSGRSDDHMNRRLLFGKIMGGEWDKSEINFEESLIYKAAEDRFINNVSWEETEKIQQSFNKVDDWKSQGSKYKTRKEVLERYDRFDNLYEKIKTEGYLSQKKILSNTKQINDGLFLDTLDEVTVDVGRDGELLLVDGSHRLAIAKLLDLDEIPVVFLVRHKEWMEYRDKLCQSNDPIPDHPDLRDLK